jgi:ligand-binding sensor domain-containing protein
MAKLLKFLFIISVLPGFLFAQHKRYKFERISIEDGLSSPYVNCFLQDQQGFLWIGTPSGLNRFDGYQFKIYKHDPLDPTTISNNAITALYEDSLGHLWIGTGAGGLNKFDPITETFTSWQHDHGNSYSLCDNNIVTIHGSRDGGLWIGTLDGLARISNDYLYGNEQELSFRIFKHDSIDLYSLSHNFIKSIYEDKNGMVWIGTERGGLNRFDPTEEKFYHRFNANENDLFWKEKHSLPFVPVLCFYGDSSQEENIFWIGTAHGVFKYQLHLAKTTRYRPNNPGFIYEPKGHFHSLIKDRDGMLWIATRKNGILLFDEKKNDLISLKHDYTDPYSLSHNWISTLYQDRSGAIWVGTSGSGLCQYSPRRWKFKHYPLESDELAGKRNFSVTAIFEDLQEKGKILWIGAGDQGLLRYNRETNVIRRIYFKGRSNYFVNFLYQDPSNPANLWIACRGDGLLKLNKKSKLFTQYKLVSPEEEFQRNPNRKDLVSTSYLNTFIRDRNGHFWLASGLGVYRFDPQTTKFTPHLHDPENNNSLSDNYVKIVFEDDQGKLWFGTVFGGLDLFDPVNNKFIHFQNNPQDSLSISNNCITSIHQDKNGIMWIGTAVGLNRYDSTRTCFIRYGQKDGIAGETIWGILQDQQGNLWFTSGQGLTQFNPETGKCINYDLDDGLQGNDFNSLAYHQSRRGEMFYGGQNGFNAFFPDSLKKNDAIPRVVLTDLKIFNKSVKPGADSPLKQALTETLEIVLKHDQSIFSFEFAALDYTIPKKNKYAYQMEGVDPDWVYTDASRRFATYTQLSPGNYTFNVKASNNDGIWNEEGLSIRITILPPWWRTNWAYLAYFLTIGAVKWSIWKPKNCRKLII